MPIHESVTKEEEAYGAEELRNVQKVEFVIFPDGREIDGFVTDIAYFLHGYYHTVSGLFCDCRKVDPALAKQMCLFKDR